MVIAPLSFSKDECPS